jgi:hypothetical protein
MRRLASFFGGIIVFLLGCVILTGLSLFIVGAFCVTWPVLRLSPRDAKLRAGMDAALALATLVTVMKPDLVTPQAPQEDEPEAAPNDT